MFYFSSLNFWKQNIHCVYLLSACPSGRHGKHCLLECECAGSLCDPETGECVCEAGKTGDNCDEGKQGSLGLATVLEVCVSMFSLSEHYIYTMIFVFKSQW